MTRVGLQSSAVGEGDSAGNTGHCETAGFDAQFQLTVAFDAAPVPLAAEGEAAPEAEAEGSEPAEEDSEEAEEG